MRNLIFYIVKNGKQIYMGGDPDHMEAAMPDAASMSRAETANFLGISTDTLDRLRAAGRIKAFSAGERLVRFQKSELEAFMSRECTTTTSSEPKARPDGMSNGRKMAVRAASARGREAVQRLRHSSRHFA